ncbi:MAG: xanthine dehydrogenase family protein molybdopterin-binding subunit [Bacillota bacterium]
MGPTRVVGEPVVRKGAADRVTGRTKFAVDMKLPGMLYAKVLRSPVARARIEEIDATEARNTPGVVWVLTFQDFNGRVPRFGPVIEDQPILADGQVRYHGEPVAAVVACDEHAADVGLSGIRVRYEQLPPVVTLEDALAPGSPLVHAAFERPGNPFAETNILQEWKYGWGNVESAEEQCSLVIENTYWFPPVFHFSLEPYTCLAQADSEGVTVWSPVQHPFLLRKVIASSLGLPVAKVRVVSTEIGGGFGGKGYPKLETLAAYVSLKLNRPIKLVVTMEESFFHARRAAAKVHIRSGFDKQGQIVFQDVRADYMIGAYADVSPRVVAKASYLACGAYRTPNARIVARAVYSNTVPSTAFRGFGAPQLVWAVEMQLAEASQRLGIDPVQLRLRNLPQKGEELVPGDRPVDGDWRAGLQKVANTLGWDTPRKPGVGRGVAIGIKSSVPATVSQAIVRIHADGSATVNVGTSEMGQGAMTVMAQIVSECLGISVERIRVVLGDTAAVPWDPITASSRSTVCMGAAVYSACQDIIGQLVVLAAKELGVEIEQVRIERHLVRAPGRELTWRELLERWFARQPAELIGVGEFRGEFVPGHPLGGPTPFWEVVFTGAEVSVDKESGQITVTKLVNVSDVGRVIHPLQAKGQEQGAAVMGLGHTLMESLVFDPQDGCLRNAGVLDYRVPTVMDVPAVLVGEFVEHGDGPGPFGCKGLGESGILAVAPAVAAAVFDATGKLIRELPLTPERVWRALDGSS